MTAFDIIVGIASVLGSVATAYLAYKIYQYNRLSAAWLSVVWAFVLIIVRRGISFLLTYPMSTNLSALLRATESICTSLGSGACSRTSRGSTW